MKVTVKAVVVGVVLGGAVSFGLGVLDGAIRAKGGQPLDWTMRMGTSTAIGMVGFILTSVLSGNKALRLAGAADDQRAKQFAPDPQRGVIYVFRDAFVGKLLGVDVLIDGRPAAQTRGKTFIRLEVSPGDHVVSCVSPSDRSQVDLPVSVAASAIVYVEQQMKMGAMRAGYALALNGEADSQKRIRRCRMLAVG